MNIPTEPKKLIVILGPNGVGKSTTARHFVEQCPRSALVDADWFCAVNPFPPTQAGQQAITDNLFCLFKNYLLCKDFDIIIFPYGFHGERKNTFEHVIERLASEEFDFQLHIIVLTCSYEENIKRAKADGREEERIARGMKNTYHFYDDYAYPVINTTKLQPEQVVMHILKICRVEEPFDINL